MAGTIVLLLTTVLVRPWEYYSVCNAGFGFEPHAVESAGHWLIGFAPEPRDGYPVRPARAEYWWRVAAAAALLVLELCVVLRRRARSGG